jgi:hypothetical protein
MMMKVQLEHSVNKRSSIVVLDELTAWQADKQNTGT